MLIDAENSASFLSDVRENPVNAALLERVPELGLKDCWLVAGCLFQTVWNLKCGEPPAAQIRDYDVFYFDPADLSYEEEDREIRRLAQAFAGLDVSIELRNQARVHLWYEKRFGHAYPPLSGSTVGIDRFLVACTCVGVRCTGNEPQDVYATFGLGDLYAGILRNNPANSKPELFEKKAASYRERWPWLRVEG